MHLAGAGAARSTSLWDPEENIKIMRRLELIV
jgi:hypothetical protein